MLPLKKLVGILFMLELTEQIFYGTLIFRQSSMICTGRHVGGHTLVLQHGGQNYFLLTSC